MSVIIKKLVKLDIDILVKASKIFYDKIVSQDWALEYLSSPNNFFYVAILNDQLVGFICGNYLDIWQKEFKEIFIYDLEVLTQFRRQGLGKSLINQVIIDGKNLGYKDPWLLTEDDNKVAKAFYLATKGKASKTILFSF